MTLDELLTEANNALGRGQIVIQVTRYESRNPNATLLYHSASYELRPSTPEERQNGVRIVFDKEWTP